MKRKQTNINPYPIVKHFQGQHATARAFGVTQQAVHCWLKQWDERRRGIPEKRHIKLAKLMPERYGYLVA